MIGHFKQPIEKNCQNCGKSFTITHQHNKYCSDKCKKEGKLHLRREHYKNLDPIKRKELSDKATNWRKNNLEKYQKARRKIYDNKKEEIKRRTEEFRQKALVLIGNKCYLCGSIENIHFHELHGKDHPRSRPHNYIYYIAHPNDFVPLCFRHHHMLHSMSYASPIVIDRLTDLLSILKHNKDSIQNIVLFR